MAPFLRDRIGTISAATGAEVEVVQMINDFYGEIVTTAGLLAGRDILGRLQPDTRAGDLVLLPAESLNTDRLFIDSLPMSELEDQLRPAQLVTGFEITAALREAAA